MSRSPDKVDVLSYHGGEEYRTIEAGRGEEVVEAHERELSRRRWMRLAVGVGVVAVVLGYGVVTDRFALGVLASLIVVAGFYVGGRQSDRPVPEVVERNVWRERAERQYDIEDGPD